MNDTTKRFKRSTSEAFASERYHSIEHYRKQSYSWPAVLVLCIIVLVAGVHLFSAGISALNEAEATEAARIEAIEQAQAEKRKQAALQEMCGGPESTPVDLGGGMYDCVSKRGFKQRVK